MRIFVIAVLLFSCSARKSDGVVHAREADGKFTAADISPACASLSPACAGLSFGYCQTADGVCFNVQSDESGDQFCPVGTLYCGARASNRDLIPDAACDGYPARCVDSYGDCMAPSGACSGTWQDENGNVNCWPSTAFCPGRSDPPKGDCNDYGPYFCHWEGTCNASGGCDCTHPDHYAASEQCGVWHAVIVPPGMSCKPGDRSYCNYQGTCAADGMACVCEDPTHYSPADQCLNWRDHVIPPGDACLPGNALDCHGNGICDTAGDGCICNPHYLASEMCSTFHSTFALLFSEAQFNQLFPDRAPFYTYAGLQAAAEASVRFLGEGFEARELAAFLAHVSHETSALKYVDEIGCPDCAYCDPSSTDYVCAAGQSYHGRGPLQLSWNYNYGQAAVALGQNLLADPGLVSRDQAIAWQSALWFWMTPQGPKPSAHDAITGRYTPSSDDLAAGRADGFGLTTDILNGGIECGTYGSPTAQDADRVALFQSYAQLLGASDLGGPVSCSAMQKF
jgi:basic endochitinase B